MASIILDQHGQPFATPLTESRREVAALRREIVRIRGKYDAAQTTPHNQMHWLRADSLDPHSASSHDVRRILRSRSRYECIENNPYLKGVLLTLAGDFVGSGPKLDVTDKRISEERRNLIETRFSDWAKAIGFRQKIWRLKFSKTVDGESFLFPFTDEQSDDEVRLNFSVEEADRVGEPFGALSKQAATQVDGVRYNAWNQPLAYCLLDSHPGSTLHAMSRDGQWVAANQVIHWFRQDRGWLRGVPELTPSLPLCALLRRYTLAVVRAAEIAADFAGVIETEGPPAAVAFTDGRGNIRDDASAFDAFPLDMGLITTLPWGYKLKQLAAEQPTTVYDAFVNALLREILRPLCVPFNVGVGSSQDSNMAAGTLDANIYRVSQEQERQSCEEAVLDKVMRLWWQEGILLDMYFDDPSIRESDFLLENPSLMRTPPKHRWRWDPVTLEHTDPRKVALALQTLHRSGFLTDRDIQEGRFNRRIEDWQDEIKRDREFRRSIGMLDTLDENAPPEKERDSDEER